jgi:cytochrome c oxidase subunit IV
MSEHVSSKKLYYIIFAALLILTYITVGVSKIDLGPMNTIVALAIAVTKAVLVVLFFMHVRYSTKLTKLVVASGFVWLGIMFLLTMMDFATRGWVRPNP